MPQACAAFGCTNRRNIQNKHRGITFHKFPKDPGLRKAWAIAVRRKDFEPSDAAVLCSCHFKADDLDRTGQIVRVKECVIPSVFASFPDHLNKVPNKARSTRTSTQAGQASDDPVHVCESPEPLNSSTSVLHSDLDRSNMVDAQTHSGDIQQRRISCEAEGSSSSKRKVMDYKWQHRHLQCAFCRYQCKSNGTFRIHVGTCHPFHCEEMDIGRLGKIIFYQKSAKLFHCQRCFFTAKTYVRVYDHVIISHSFSEKNKGHANGEPKDYLSDSNDSKDVPDNDNDTDVEGPGKLTSLNAVKNEDEELNDEDSRHSSSPGQLPEGKKEAGSDEEQPLDGEDFPDYPPGKREAGKAEEAHLSKYIRRIGPRYYCNICNWRGKMKGFMFNHVTKKHNIPKSFSCKECGKSFLLESMLLSHVSVYHRQGIYQCPFCCFRTNHLRGVRRHLNNCNAKWGEGTSDSDEHD
ncbi:chromosome alignment-maintaining phosphoprotein 1-like [Megalops cyprinoides]|uniref:chromosome alignment-maintaining phosphoprotein 1-like n=1 Tax=Megalops cyprinoides TaxID=118141 RepID=UPI0018656B94|nr:chromosome alignment-maintaining phosphoprotein 1-like [Megalops cyprinoides]